MAEYTANEIFKHLGIVNKKIPVCSQCRSSDIVCDAWAAWNPETQQWELDNTFDEKFCNGCEGSCSVEWVDAAAHHEPDEDEEEPEKIISC